jgi:Lrp/AsnC family transcriptional regulator, leucine-responsive regulatory protein
MPTTSARAKKPLSPARGPAAPESAPPLSLDALDLRILAALRRDARASLQDIGRTVGLSTTPCWNRIKRMEAQGVIEGYTVSLSAPALGYCEVFIVQVTLESHSDDMLAAFGRALAEIPEVTEALLVSGDYDYALRVLVKDTRDYERLLREKLYKIPGIRHSRSSVVLRSLKSEQVPLPAGLGPRASARPRKR